MRSRTRPSENTNKKRAWGDEATGGALWWQGRIDPPKAGRGHATPVQPVQRIYAAFEFQVLPWMIPWAGWWKLASRCLHSHLPLA